MRSVERRGREFTEEIGRVRIREGSDTSAAESVEGATGRHGDSSIFKTGEKVISRTLGFSPTCSCNAGTVPGTVLDPFFGSGTTGLVASKLHCKCIGVELNREYIQIAAKRLSQEVFDFHEPPSTVRSELSGQHSKLLTAESGESNPN